MNEVEGNANGSVAEGIVVYYHNTKHLEKYTFKNDKGKWHGKTQGTTS